MDVFNTTSTSEETEIEDHQLAAMIIFMVRNITAFFTRRLATLNNPFGRLTASQATGELVICATFCSYYTPMVFFDVTVMKEHARHAGLIMLMCYNICIISHLTISLNRMCAICLPLKYKTYFSHRNTSIFIVVTWIISITAAFFLHGGEDCSFFYSDVAWAFVFKENETCGIISWYFDFGQDFSVVVIIAVVDTITIVKVRTTSKQAVAQGVVFAVELCLYFFIAWTFQNRWIIFASTTVAWNLVHCTDPIIIIICNKEFLRFVCRPLRKTLQTSTVIPPYPTSMQVSCALQGTYSYQLGTTTKNVTAQYDNPYRISQCI